MSVTTPVPGPAADMSHQVVLQGVEKGHLQARGEGATEGTPSLGGASHTLTKAFSLSLSCKSNKLLVFPARRKGDRGAC